jgi:hypothetical protein
MKNVRRLLVLFAFVGIAAALGVLDFEVWQLAHPTAPTWVYFFLR